MERQTIFIDTETIELKELEESIEEVETHAAENEGI